MILRILQFQSQIETRGCLKCDVFGWGEAIAAGVQTAGAVYNNERSLALQKAMFEAQQDWAAESFYKNLEFEHKMTNQAQDFQREMWQRQIDYNDPSAQIQRLMDAGINPNAAAGMVSAGGAAASGSVSAPSGASAAMPSGSVPHLSNPFESLSELPMRLLQQDSIKQQIETEKSKQNLNDSQARNLDEQTKGFIIENDWKPFEKQADIDQSYAKVDLMVKQGDLAVEQANQIKEMLPYLKNLNVAQQNKLFAETQKALVEINQVNASIRLLNEQVITEKHRQANLDAASYQAFMSGQQSQSVIEYNGKLMSVAEAEKTLKDLEATALDHKTKYEDYLRSQGIDPNATGNPFSSFVLSANGQQTSEQIQQDINNLYKTIYGSYDDTQLRLHSFSGVSLSGVR